MHCPTSRNWPKSDLARGKLAFNSKKAGKKPRHFFSRVEFYKMIISYDYSSAITKQDEKKLKIRLESIFNTGKFDKSTPPFQTHGDLYKYPESDIFIKTFIDACSKYQEQSLQYRDLMMWCYMDYRRNYDIVKKLTGKGFHKHSDNQSRYNQLSGVYYLVNPRNESTIFKDRESPKARPFSWFIYPSFLEHRPPDIKSFRRRYTLAAEIFY